MLGIEKIAEAIPRHIGFGRGGPWRISKNTLAAYNRDNGTVYTITSMPNRGRDIAEWLLQKIAERLIEASNTQRLPTAVEVVTGYLAGWREMVKEFAGKPFSPPAQKWRDMAKAIVDDAERKQESLMHEKNGAVKEQPKAKPKFKKANYSSMASAAWGGLSFLALYMIAKRRGR